MPSIRREQVRPFRAWHEMALGREPQLRVHFAAALNVGLTPAELEEIIIHTVIFAGFPTAINAMNLLHTVLAERNGASKTT